jgi:hypothetical protein
MGCIYMSLNSFCDRPQRCCSSRGFWRTLCNALIRLTTLPAVTNVSLIYIWQKRPISVFFFLLYKPVLLTVEFLHWVFWTLWIVQRSCKLAQSHCSQVEGSVHICYILDTMIIVSRGERWKQSDESNGRGHWLYIPGKKNCTIQLHCTHFVVYVENTNWLSKEVALKSPIKKHIYSRAQIMYENLRHSFKSKILEVTALINE